LDGPNERLEPFVERPSAGPAHFLVEGRGNRPAQTVLDKLLQVGTGKASERSQHLLNARRRPETGQHLGNEPVQLQLAFEKDPIEVENDRVEAAHASSNNAVPIRTAVAPSITAGSKSLDIPMLSPWTSWRRASSARS